MESCVKEKIFYVCDLFISEREKEVSLPLAAHLVKVSECYTLISTCYFKLLLALRSLLYTACFFHFAVRKTGYVTSD